MRAFPFSGFALQLDGRLATSKAEISEELRKTFFLGQHLKGRSFNEDHYVEVTRRVRNQDRQINVEHDEELFHEDFSMYELECAIKDVPQSDAFNNDGIHASMLIHFGIRMTLRLLKLFNSCWHESTWLWNSSRVIFIKKPGKSNYASSSSYRLLTLSSHVGKLFERMINRRLRTFFTSCKIIEEEQESFREKRSTVRSLYRRQLELEDVQRNKKPAALLNTDLEKAFDSVWIDGLLYKLQNMEIKRNLLSIIQLFLSNRLSIKKIGNYHSNNFPNHIGLPQGSVLSPTLFILFINDFIDAYPIRFKFADNTALILTTDDILQLTNRRQAAADDKKRWCDKWRMAVNGSKTEIVLFNYNSNDPFETALNFDICSVKTSSKSLRIIIDNKTNFKGHAKLSVAKTQRIWAAITSKCTNRWCLSLTTQVYLYRIIILPQVMYGAPLWYHKKTNQLRRLQNIVMKKFSNMVHLPVLRRVKR